MRAWETVARFELRVALRGQRGPLALGLTVLAGGLVVCLFLLLTPEMRLGCTPEEMTRAGRALFRWLSLLEGVVVLLLVPVLTADALAGERRRGTLEAVLLTRLTLKDLVLGKLAAAIGFLLLALFCLLPVQSLALILGGVSPLEILLVLLLLMAIAWSLGAMGLYCSARLEGWRALLAALAGGLLVVSPLLVLAQPLTRLRRAPRTAPRGWVGPGLSFQHAVITGVALLGLLLLGGPVVMLASVSPAGAFVLLLFDRLPGARYWWLATLVALALLRFYARLLLDAAARDLEPAPRQAVPPLPIMPVCPPQDSAADSTPSRRW